MTFDDFRATLSGDTPPSVSAALRALWFAAKGDWDHAHRIAQDIDDRSGAWVHAYLHRTEGDLGNARYWYRQARQQEATDALEDEWSRIASALLAE